MKAGFIVSVIAGLLLSVWIDFSDQRQRGTPPSSGEKVSFQCQNQVLLLKCNKNEVLRIVRANYGRFVMKICNARGVSSGWNTQCLSLSKDVVARRCDGYRECSFTVDNKTFKDNCPKTYKYIEVNYYCESVPTAPPKPKTRPTTKKPDCECHPKGAYSPCVDLSGTCECYLHIVGSYCTRCEYGYINFPKCIRPTTTTTTTTTTASPKPRATTLKPRRTTSQPHRYCDDLDAADTQVTWPRTRVGKSAKVGCPPQQDGFMTWRCGPQGWIGDPDYSDCKSNWITEIPDKMSHRDLKKLELGTRSNVLEPADIKLTASRLEVMSRLMKRSEEEVEEVVTSIVHTCSNMLEERNSQSWKRLPEMDRIQVATKLVVTMEKTGFKMANSDDMTTDETITMAGENILMEVKVIETASQDVDTLEDIHLPSGQQTSGPWLDYSDQMIIPRENLASLTADGKVKVVFVTYNKLDVILNLAVSSGPGVSQRGPGYTSINTSQQWVVNTNIMSTSINSPASTIRLTKPVRFTLAHTNASLNFEPVCSFWNYSDSTFLGSWSSAGCRLVEPLSNHTHSTCECDHLTNFAVLMDVHGTTRKLSENDLVTLEVITYTGCIISIFCLLLAFVTFSVFKNLQSDRNTIHKNLVLCLMIAEILFLAGIHQTAHPATCAAIAGFLHFLFLVCFAWMCLEGVHLYVMLIEVFEAERSRRKWYYLFGYGIPTIVVAISAGVNHKGYGTDYYCWLRTDTHFIWSFVGPVAAVITLNIVMLAMAVYMMCRHSHTTVPITSKQQTTLHKYSPMIKGAAVLVVLLGLTWTFGILFINANTVVMAYIFTVLNSLQGLAIFLFHCLLNEKVQKEYRKYVRHATWLPYWIRSNYGGYDSQITSPNQSSSSTSGHNYFTRLWSKRKRSTSSFNMKNSPSREASRRPDSYSRESTLLTPGSHQNGFTFHSGPPSWPPPIPDHGPDHGGMNGDLSLADCSVINSDAVNDYNDRYRGKAAAYDDHAIPEMVGGEPVYAEIGDVNHYLSVDVVAKPPKADGYEIPTERIYSNNCSSDELPPIKSPSGDDNENFVRSRGSVDARASYRKAIGNPQYGTRDSLNPLLGDFVDTYPGDMDATLPIRRGYRQSVS